MNGEILQLIAIASGANAALSGRWNASGFDEHQAFTYCQSVRFVELKRSMGKKKPIEDEVAASPEGWFGLLNKQGARCVFLNYGSSKDQQAPDYQLVAFVGGGGTWTLGVSDGSSKVTYWVARWLSRRSHPEGKPWEVTYGKVAESRSAPSVPLPDQTDLRKRFTSTLKDIRRLAQEIEADNFEQFFDRGLRALDSADPMDHFPGDALARPMDYSLESRQLFAAAWASWVFGGMGSWNDLWIQDEQLSRRYDALSARLYDAICQSIILTVNSAAQNNLVAN